MTEFASYRFHFPLPQERGVVLTLHPDAAPQLNAFVSECTLRL